MPLHFRDARKLAGDDSVHRNDGAAAAVSYAQERTIRIGLIGLDTSHAVAFTQLLNDPSRPDHVPGARVVAAFKGGSPDIEASATRIEKFTAELRDTWKSRAGRFDRRARAPRRRRDVDQRRCPPASRAGARRAGGAEAAVRGQAVHRERQGCRGAGAARARARDADLQLVVAALHG